MTDKEKYLKLSDFDKLRYTIRGVLEDIKVMPKSEHVRGAHKMAEAVLIHMDTIEKFNKEEKNG